MRSPWLSKWSCPNDSVCALVLPEFCKRRCTKGAAACCNWHVTQAFGTFLGCRIRCNLATPHASEDFVHGQYHEEVDGRADQDERHQRVDEVTECELAAMHREIDRGKIGLADKGRDE